MLSAFVRVALAESIKLRRTLALRVALLAPLLVVVLYALLVHQRPALFRGRDDLWQSFAKSICGLWALLMLPLLVTLQAALLAQLEHSDKQWKDLFAQPVPRACYYLAKLLGAVLLAALSTAVLWAGTFAAGRLLQLFRPELNFAPAIPWAALLLMTRILGLALLMIAIQHWVSLRWPSFTVAVGVGIAAVVTGFVLVNSDKFAPWYPWTLTAQAIAERPRTTVNSLAVSIAGFAIVTLAGAWHFSRREVE